MAQCTRASCVPMKGAVSQISGERSLIRNVVGAQSDIGDAISSTIRPTAVDDCFPPQSVPEVCTQPGADLTTPAETSAAIVTIGMQSFPHPDLFLPQLSQVLSSFPSISLGASSNLIIPTVTPVLTTIPPPCV